MKTFLKVKKKKIKKVEASHQQRVIVVGDRQQTAFFRGFGGHKKISLLFFSFARQQY